MAEPLNSSRLLRPRGIGSLGASRLAPRVTSTRLAPIARTTGPRLSSLTGRPAQVPDPPSWAKARAVARQPEQKKNVPWWQAVLGTTAGTLTYPGQVIKALPVIAGKIGQSLYGAAEMAVDAPLNAVGLPFGKNLYTTRLEKDWKKAREEGLGWWDSYLKAYNRQVPLVTDTLGSFQRTGARLGEAGSLGFWDTGAPGFDYWQAAKTGEVAPLLFEDLGNVILAGRLAGAGNVGVRAGARITEAGRPRLGSAVATAGRFVEEPVGTTVRGLSRGVSPAARSAAQRLTTLAEAETGRLGSIAKYLKPKLERASETTGAMATSPTPLMTGALESSRRLRQAIDTNVNKLYGQVAQLDEQGTEALLAGRTSEVERIAAEKKKIETKIGRRRKLGETFYTARKAQQEATFLEDLRRTGMATMFDRFDALGAVPEPVEALRAQAARLREDATRPQTVNPDQQIARAEMLERMADVKQANPTKLQDKANRDVNFEAALIVNSKLIDEIMVDVNAGLTVDQIAEKIIQPREISPQSAGARYAYTPAGIQRAVDFVRGALDEVDRLEMDIASQMVNTFGEVMGRMAQEPGTFVTGILPPSQFGDTPVPEFLLSELDKFGFGNAVLRVLDEQTSTVVVENYPALAADLGDAVLENPNGLFEKYTKARPDSDEYAAARLAAARGAELMGDPQTSVFRNDPRRAEQVAELFADPAIYAARMRPMLTYRESARQVLRAEDVDVILLGVRQLADDFPNVVSSRRAKTVKKLWDDLQADPNLANSLGFYRRLRDALDGVIADVRRSRKGTAGRLENITAQQIEVENRLLDVIRVREDISTIVEQALFRPEELTAPQRQQAQALRDEATRLETEAETVARQPDVLARVRGEVERETSILSRAQKDFRDNETSLRTVEEQLAPEERLLRDASLDDDGMVRFLAELDEAVRLRDTAFGREPSLNQQKAWKQERIAEVEAEMQLAEQLLAKINSAVVMEPKLVGEEVQLPSGRIQVVNRKRRGGFGLSRDQLRTEDFVDYLNRSIPNERHRRQFIRDHTVPGSRRDPNTGITTYKGITIDSAMSQSMADATFDEHTFIMAVGEAYSRYMRAKDEVRRLREMPFKGKDGDLVKQEMMAARTAELDQHPWQDPITGEEVRGIRSLPELRRVEKLLTDRDALAEQVRIVQELRSKRDNAVRQLDSSRAEVRKIQTRMDALSERLLRAEGESSSLQAQRLRGQADRLRAEADQMDQATLKAQPRLARERITMNVGGRRTRLANPVKGPQGDVVGFEFTKGVARKLDSAETTQLKAQAKLHEQQLELRAKLNEQDNAIAGGQAVRTEGDQYVQSLSAPSGTSLLRGAQRPRLLGETDQPTWIPVGEASGVFPTARAEKRITSEALAPQQILSVERQRTGTIMALTPGQFARRVSEILNETGRNRAMNKIITDKQFVSDVETVLTSEAVQKLWDESAAAVRADRVPRDPKQFENAVQQEFGTKVMQALEPLGFEPVFRGDVPDPTNPYAGGQPVGDLLGKVEVNDITPTTLVMKKGLRESINTDFSLPGASKLPAGIANFAEWVIQKTAQWKSMVLPFSARWMAGDTAGTIIFAHVRAGIDPASLAPMIMDVTERLTGNKRLTRETAKASLFGDAIADPIISAMVGSGLQTASIRTSEIVRSLPENRTFISPVEGRLGKFMPRFRQSSFNLNENINGMGRSAVAIDKLTKELDARGRSIDEIDPVSVHNDPVLYEALVGAVRSANEAMGQFSKLTPMEKKYIRTVYPFWSWMRFINSAAGQLLLNQPDRVLFYTHLGSMVLGDDAEEFYGFLEKQIPVWTPWGTMLVDLSFLNPYSDAILFANNPFKAGSETAAGISPVLKNLQSGVGEVIYGVTGQENRLFPVGSRPGYLEGRPGETTRTAGDVIGGIAYQNFRTFAGPFRFLTETTPSVTIPGTDVMLGPGPRYPQGSPRDTGIYSRALVSPTQQRIQAGLRAIGIPTASATLEQARLQNAEQRRAGLRAARRRQQERRLSRIRR